MLQTMEGRDTVIFKLSRLLVPVCELDEEARHAMVGKAQVVRLAPKSRIAAADDQGWLTYLVRGELAIRTPDGLLELVPGDSGRARRPVFNVYPHGLHAEARTNSILLRFDRSLFRCLLSEQQHPRTGTRPLGGQQLFSRVYGAWADDSLQLPAPLPEIHLLYGRDAPHTLREMTTLLRATPELCAQFLAAAHRGGGAQQPPVHHPGEASLRLGLAGSRILSLTLAARQIFALRGGMAGRLACSQFEHALLIGMLAFMLARRRGVLDPYRALAAGLVHDLGALLVPHYLAAHAETPATHGACTIAGRRLKAVAGPALVARFGFDPAIAQAAEQAEHWHRNEPVPSEADLLVVAHLIAALEDPAPPVPPWPRVPAFARLCPHTSRQEALQLLRRAYRLCAALRQRLE